MDSNNQFNLISSTLPDGVSFIENSSKQIVIQVVNKKPTTEFYMKKSMQSEDNGVTVSYTHLDVYKRQNLC